MFHPSIQQTAFRPLIVACTVAGLLLTPTLSLQVQAQSSLPNLGDDTSMSLGTERRLGDQIGREIYADPEYVSDPLLDAYLARIMQPLFAAAKARGELQPEMNSQFAWRLFLVRDKTINAFALPGGYLGVHLGLLGLVDTPDELASVLAHELTHVTQRHIARGMSKQAAAAPWLMAGTILALLVGARSSTTASNAAAQQGAIAAGQAGLIQSQLNFTRDMEREADRIGFTLMEPAGYAPSGFVAMFNKLGNASKLSDNGSFPYLRSHPLTTERIADMGSRLGTFERSTTADAPALQLHRWMSARARALADLSIDAQRRHVAAAEALSPLTALSTAVDATAQQATLYAGALAAWQLRDSARAKQLYLRLQNATPPSSHAEVRQMLMLLGAQLQASTSPLDLQSETRAVMLAAAQQRISQRQRQEDQGQLTQAAMQSVVDRLRDWLSTHPSDADAWHLLFTAQTALGSRVRAAIADAQMQRALLNDTGALARYQAAQSLIRQGVTADSVDAAIVDSKVRELEQRIRESTDRPIR